MGASPAHDRRSGMRCRGKATVHAATGRAITRAGACDVRTARQTRARSGRAARRSLLAPDLIREGLPVSLRTPCSPPCPKTYTGANQGHDHGPGWRRSRRLGVRGGGSAPPTAALDVRARGHEPCAVQPHFRPRSTPSGASGRCLRYTPPLTPAGPRAWREVQCSDMRGCAGLTATWSADRGGKPRAERL